jgi:phage tail sheath protein FI
VFEPANAAFRRRVQRTFEAVLADLYTRGAFAGATADAAFRVVIGGTPDDRDNGRFLVELRIAPAQALATVTVRLVLTGDRTAVSEGP